MLTEGLDRPELRCSRVDVEVRRRCRIGDRGQGVAVVLRAPDLHWSTCGCAARPNKGSAGSDAQRRRAIGAADRVTCSGVRGKYRRRRGSGSRQSAQEGPWARGEAAARLGGGCGAAGRRGHGGAGPRRGGATRRRWSWVAGAAAMGLGYQGVCAGAFKERGPMISEVGYGRESPEITAVISAWPLGAL